VLLSPSGVARLQLTVKPTVVSVASCVQVAFWYQRLPSSVRWRLLRWQFHHTSDDGTETGALLSR
jgi:hypothetical protein